MACCAFKELKCMYGGISFTEYVFVSVFLNWIQFTASDTASLHLTNLSVASFVVINWKI